MAARNRGRKRLMSVRAKLRRKLVRDSRSAVAVAPRAKTQTRRGCRGSGATRRALCSKDAPSHMLIQSCNVNGSPLAELCLTRAFRREVNESDILLLQDTCPSERESIIQASLPLSHQRIFFGPRPKRGATPQTGGVIVIVRNWVKVEWLQVLSSPEIVVLDTPFAIIVNVHIPPSSPDNVRGADSHCDTILKLEHVIRLARLHDKAVLVAGTFNARTGECLPDDMHPPRRSQDRAICTRGQELLRIASEHHLHVLNGTYGLDTELGSYTSFCSNGLAVVDYMLLSREYVDCVQKFTVKAKPSWSDHAVLSASFAYMPTPVPPSPYAPIPHKATNRFEKRVLSPGSVPTGPLNPRLKDIVATLPTPAEALSQLFGEVTHTSGSRIHVHVTAAIEHENMPTARASINTYFGPGSRMNFSGLVPATSVYGDVIRAFSDGASYAYRYRPWRKITFIRAHLYGIMCALLGSDPSIPLEIWSASVPAIACITQDAAAHAAVGFRGPDGDILRQIVTLIKDRGASVYIKFWKDFPHSRQAHHAQALAMEALHPQQVTDLANPGRVFPLRWSGCRPAPNSLEDTMLPKVVARLPESAAKDVKGGRSVT